MEKLESKQIEAQEFINNVEEEFFNQEKANQPVILEEAIQEKKEQDPNQEYLNALVIEAVEKPETTKLNE